MPQRTKKEQKHGRNSGRTGSRWHSFHFSGKLISCSVIFGFLLILVGGILLAIGMDRDEESKSDKSDDYGDLQKKSPLVFVGPVIMGIGGFTVVVGVIMCLVETKVFRRRGGDANPLINESGESVSRNNEGINGESDPAVIPSDSKHHRKHRHAKKSGGNGKKSSHSPRSPSSIETSPSSSQSSEPIGISGKGSRNFLNASDTFLTPPGSFTQDELQMQGAKRDAVNQTSASLMKSFNSSGTYSTEFQTPSASFIDTPSFPSSREDSIEVPTPQPLLNMPGNLNVKALENAKHQFLTPQNSNADILEPPKKPKELQPEMENSPIVNRHAFLTPKNSTDLLEESPPNEKTLEHHLGNSSNHPETFVSKRSPNKITTMRVVADVHEPSKQHASDVNNSSVQPSTNHSKHQEVEHSDIKVDVLIDAIDDEVKSNTHASASNAKDEETGMSSDNARSVGGNVDEASNLTEEKELKDRPGSGNDDLASIEDLDSRMDNNVDSLKKDE